MERVNQVWSTDITYIRMAQGFLYLVAVMDWFSRFVLSWSLSLTMEMDFCLEALDRALRRGRPERRAPHFTAYIENELPRLAALRAGGREN